MSDMQKEQQRKMDGGEMSKLIIEKCADCGKDLYLGYIRRDGTFVPQNFSVFNDGKVFRCLDCCEKQGIKRIIIKD